MHAARVILLDLDDTLFDRSAAFARWCDRHAGGCTPMLVAADARGRTSRTALARAVGADHVAAFAARFPTELAACVEPEAGVPEAVAALAARHRVAIVTNGGAAQRAKLARAGVADRVHAVFVSSEVGAAKPARAMFDAALAWSGCAPAEHVMVGDDPVNDIAPAAALGMATAWRTRGDVYPVELAPPDRTIRSLAEVLR